MRPGPLDSETGQVHRQEKYNTKQNKKCRPLLGMCPALPAAGSPAACSPMQIDLSTCLACIWTQVVYVDRSAWQHSRPRATFRCTHEHHLLISSVWPGVQPIIHTGSYQDGLTSEFHHGRESFAVQDANISILLKFGEYEAKEAPPKNIVHLNSSWVGFGNGGVGGGECGRSESENLGICQ